MGLLDTDSLTQLHWIGIALGAITAVIHLALGVQFSDPRLIVAGVGFVGGIALILANVQRRLVYLLGIPFTAGQIVLYFYFNWPDVWGPAGIGDKVVQVLFIVVLIELYRRETASGAAV